MKKVVAVLLVLFSLKSFDIFLKRFLFTILNNKKLAPSPMQQLEDVTGATLGAQKENERQELK